MTRKNDKISSEKRAGVRNELVFIEDEASFAAEILMYFRSSKPFLVGGLKVRQQETAMLYGLN